MDMHKLIKAALPLFMIAALSIAPSCIFDPEKTDPPPDDPIEWPDLTQRDDVISTIVLCYENPTKNEAMVRYEGLLHSQYYFQFHPDDIDPDIGPILTRATDLQSTQWIFDNQTWLELEVPETGSWSAKPDINGEPCENCYETMRSYYIKAQFGDETTYYQSPPERAFVMIVVAPDEGDASKWVLRAVIDLGI
jgi:hypothetical protein